MGTFTGTEQNFGWVLGGCRAGRKIAGWVVGGCTRVPECMVLAWVPGVIAPGPHLCTVVQGGQG